MDLRRLIVIFRTWFPALMAAIVLAGAAGYLVSSLQPKLYESRETLIVGQSLAAINPDYNQLLVSQRLSGTYAAVAETRPILEKVISKLGLEDTPEELALRVRADAPLDTALLRITAQDSDPSMASAIASAMGAELIAASPAIQGREATLQQSIDAQLAATRDQIAGAQAQLTVLTDNPERTAEDDAALQALEGRLTSLRATYATLLSFSAGDAANLLTVVEPAVADPEPVSPRMLLNTLLAAALGLLVVGGIAFAIEYFSDSIKDADAVEEVAHLSTLGQIATMRGGADRTEIYRLAAILYPRSGVTEAYRRLRTNVEFATLDVPVRTLLVTSSMPGEGKTVTAANLAAVFAQADYRVLLVDADLRRPGVHKVFDARNTVGLTTLVRESQVTVDAVAQATEQPNLRILTTGPLPPNPAELLRSPRMQTVIEKLVAVADLVIIDSPPLLAVAILAILSSLADGTLLVIDAGRGRRRAVSESREVLLKAGARVLGVALNRVPARDRADYAGYYETVVTDGQPVPVDGVARDLPGAST